MDHVTLRAPPGPDRASWDRRCLLFTRPFSLPAHFSFLLALASLQADLPPTVTSTGYDRPVPCWIEIGTEASGADTASRAHRRPSSRPSRRRRGVGGGRGAGGQSGGFRWCDTRDVHGDEYALGDMGTSRIVDQRLATLTLLDASYQTVGSPVTQQF